MRKSPLFSIYQQKLCDLMAVFTAVPKAFESLPACQLYAISMLFSSPCCLSHLRKVCNQTAVLCSWADVIKRTNPSLHPTDASYTHGPLFSTSCLFKAFHDQMAQLWSSQIRISDQAIHFLPCLPHAIQSSMPELLKTSAR